MEYVTFILLKKLYGIKLWDYTDMKFNINEKVCLEFAIAWGALGAIYIKYILPVLANVFNRVDRITLIVSMVFLSIIILTDFIYSSYILMSKKNEEKEVV